MDVSADAMPDRVGPRPRPRPPVAAAAADPTASLLDETMLQRVAGGDAAALAALYQRYRTRLFGFLQQYLGANGAGKTTLMRLLTGLIRPDTGRITVGGREMSTADGGLAAQRVLGYLPQDLGMYPDLSARQFLDYIALLKGLDDRSARRRRIGELVELVNRC